MKKIVCFVAMMLGTSLHLAAQPTPELAPQTQPSQLLITEDGVPTDASVDQTDDFAVLPEAMPGHSSMGEAPVVLTNITTPLCPTQLEAGDRDFGHAPKVNITVDLEISPDGSGLIAVIYFTARERRGVQSSFVTGEWRKNVYTAPARMKITGLNPSVISSKVENFVGGDAGAEFGPCKPGVICLASPGGLIKRVAWIGDTGGDDVAAPGATECPCDTHIKFIEFNPVRISTTRR